MGISIESTSTRVDTLLSRFALATIIVLMFLGRDLVLPRLREAALEEADDFLVEAGELTEESTGKGVSGRVRITESMRKIGKR